MNERPQSVRPARAGDEDKLFNLLCLAYRENAPFTMSDRKVRALIEAGTSPDKEVIIGVVESDGGIVASVGALFTQWWYTEDFHIDELWNFVHPDHRRSEYAKDLISYMKWISDQMDMTLHMGVLTTTRVEAKIRLYGRQLKQTGAFFMHNLKAAGGPLADEAIGEENGR